VHNTEMEDLQEVINIMSHWKFTQLLVCITNAALPLNLTSHKHSQLNIS